MIRSLSFGFFLTTMAVSATSPVFAAAPQSAQEEAVRRQSAILEARFALERAQAVALQGDRAKAAEAYEQAYRAAMVVGGSGLEEELKQIVAGLASAKIDLAKAAYKEGNVATAIDHLKRVLAVDPTNPTAASLKETYDKTAESLRGRLPSPEVQRQVPVEMERRVKAGTLVQDGRLLFEIGNLDQAEKKLQEAAELDPYNEAAFYYLDLIKNRRYSEDARKRELSAKEAIVQVERAWASPTKHLLLPVPNPMAKTNLVYTGQGRTQIYKMLELRLDEVLFDGLPLSEVIKFLDDEVRKIDPAKQGINFMMQAGDGGGGGAPPVTVDPVTGAVIPAPPVDNVDLSLVTVRINPPLRKVRLADVLDAITKVSDRPLKFSVEEYAIIFSAKRPEAAQLFTRTWQVDPNTFRQGLENVTGTSFGDFDTGGQGGGGQGGGGRGGGGRGGGGGQGGDDGGLIDSFLIPRVQVARQQQGQGGQGGQQGGFDPTGGQGGQGQGAGISAVTRTIDTTTIQDLARQFFIAAGVNLAPPANVFWNDRSGLLLVRAPLADLDLVEEAIKVLNKLPPQIMLEAKFAEVTQSDAKALGFDWTLGSFGGDVVASGGTQPSLNGVANNLNPFGTFPGAPQTPSFLTGNGSLVPGAASTLIPQSSSDGLITSGVRTSGIGPEGRSIPAVATVTGILTDPQFRVVIRALEQRTGIDLLSAPRITTISGRQTQIAVVDIQTIVTSVDLNQQGAGQNQNQNQNTPGGFNNSAIGSTVSYVTQPLPFGPVLDVVPYVSSDGFTIQMTIIPTLAQFLGYDDPGAFIPQAQSAAGNQLGTPLTAQLPLPRLRARQLVTSANVWDGQTVMLGGLLAEDVAKIKDKIPVLGDLPWVGRLFRSEGRVSSKKNLIIFVTPTIIDPAGNRVHNDADLPFTKAQTPAQPLAGQ